MTRWFIGLLLALFFVVTLIASAPARLLSQVLPTDKLIMQGFSGTLWRGTASRCLIAAGPGYIHLGAVSWSLRPLSLLWFAPSFELHSEWGSQRATGQVTVHNSAQISFDDFEANLPAHLVRQFLPLSVAGELSVQLQELEIRAGMPYAAEGRLVWQNAAWESLSGMQPLGSYALTFKQPAGQVLTGEVLTLGGPVEASGSVQLEDRSYAIDVLVSSEASLDSQLQQALDLIASPVSDGYRVQLQSQF